MANSENVKNTSDSSFNQEVLQGTGLKLVDFWAEWCGPCRMLAPTIESLATDYQGKLGVFKMNVDDNPATPAQFSIRGIPTVILFKDGKMVDQIVGNQSKDIFVQTIQKHL